METIREPKLEDLGIVKLSDCKFMCKDLCAELEHFEHPATTIEYDTENDKKIFCLNCTKLELKKQQEYDWEAPSSFANTYTCFETISFEGSFSIKFYDYMERLKIRQITDCCYQIHVYVFQYKKDGLYYQETRWFIYSDEYYDEEDEE